MNDNLNIKEHRESFLQNKSLIKTLAPFNLLENPTRIIMRPCSKEALNFFLCCEKYDLEQYLTIYGNPGVGKTVTILHIKKELSELQGFNLKIFYISCKENSTSFKCFKALAEEIGKRKEVKGHAREEASGIFFDNLNSDCIIVLDEIDKLKDPDDLVYLLTRAKQIRPKLNNKIHLLFISNNPHWQSKLQKSTLSSLGFNSLFFPSFSSVELMRLLKSRIEQGLEKGVIENTTIAYLSKKIIQESEADARVGLFILQNAIKELEFKKENKINEEDIDRVYVESVRNLQRYCLRLLDKKSCYISYLCGECLPELTHKPLQAIYKCYLKECKDNQETPVHYTTFKAVIDNLETQKLIRQTKKRKGRYFEKLIEPLIDVSVLREEYFTLWGVK